MSYQPERRKNKNYKYDIFIRATLGRFLPHCLQEVTERRPADPIEFIAEWLYKVYDSQMYYKEKIKYLQELCNTDIIMKKEKSDHEAKMKPFVESMRLQRWNYYVSLNEELEALADYIENVDVFVDDKSKLRFLEVQELINSAEAELELADTGSKTPSIHSLKSIINSQENVARGNTGLETPRSVRDGLQAISPGIAKSNVASALSTKSGRRKPVTKGGVRKILVRDTVSAVRTEARHRSSGLYAKIHARAIRSMGRQYQEELSVGKDSDMSTYSMMSKDGSEFPSVLSQNQDSTDISKSKTHHAEKSDSAISKSNLKNSTDERVSESGSFITESLRSSFEYITDSDVGNHGEHLITNTKENTIDSEGIPSEPHTRRKQKRRQAASKLSAPKRYDDGDDVLPLSTKEFGNLMSQIGPKQLCDYKSGTRFPLVNKFPAITSRDASEVKAQTSSICYDQDDVQIKRSGLVRHGGLRSTTGKDDEDDEEDDDDGEEDEELRPNQDNKKSTKKKRSGERLYFPSVRTHAGTSVDHQREHRASARSLPSDQVVQLPVIPPVARTTGTLIMTNGGHIAFVSKKFGVVASNSLKIRSVHPIDKPEMWEQKKFQSQSFYDHELYSQGEVLPTDSEDDEYKYRHIPKMTMEEFMAPPHRKWTSNKDNRFP